MGGLPVLPTEIWIHIIGALRQELLYPTAYRLDPVWTSGLTQLCQVNSTFNALATPCLYSRCAITPTSLQAFFRSVQGEASGNRRKVVTSLALTRFGADELGDEKLEQMAAVLRTTRTSLRRLFLDVACNCGFYNRRYGHDQPPSPAAIAMTAALGALSDLEEFCMTDIKMGLDQLPVWTRLRRLAVSGQTSEFIVPIMRELACLETCILAWPYDVHLREERELLSGRWVKDGGRGQELVIPVAPLDKVLDQFIACLGDEEGTDGEGEGKGVVKLMHVPEVRADRNPWVYWSTQKRDWFLQVVLDGSIWEREREPWALCVGNPSWPFTKFSHQ